MIFSLVRTCKGLLKNNLAWISKGLFFDIEQKIVNAKLFMYCLIFNENHMRLSQFEMIIISYKFITNLASWHNFIFSSKMIKKWHTTYFFFVWKVFSSFVLICHTSASNFDCYKTTLLILPLFMVCIHFYAFQLLR